MEEGGCRGGRLESMGGDTSPAVLVVVVMSLFSDPADPLLPKLTIFLNDKGGYLEAAGCTEVTEASTITLFRAKHNVKKMANQKRICDVILEYTQLSHTSFYVSCLVLLHCV